ELPLRRHQAANPQEASVVGPNRSRQDPFSLGKGHAAAVAKIDGPGAGDLVTLADLLAQRASDHGDRLAFRFVADGTPSQTLSYRQLFLRASSVATELTERGLVGER